MKQIIIKIDEKGISSGFKFEDVTDIDLGLFIKEFELIKIQLLKLSSKGRDITFKNE